MAGYQGKSPRQSQIDRVRMFVIGREDKLSPELREQRVLEEKAALIPVDENVLNRDMSIPEPQIKGERE